MKRMVLGPFDVENARHIDSKVVVVTLMETVLLYKQHGGILQYHPLLSHGSDHLCLEKQNVLGFGRCSLVV